jgi:hypothetical protein
MAVNNKTVQCNLILERQLESGNFKVIQKRSKYVQCHLKLEELRKKNVGNSITKCHSVATNTDCDESISATCIGSVLYALRTVAEFRCLRYEVCYEHSDRIELAIFVIC